MADAADKTNGSAGGAVPKPDPPGYFEGESMSRRKALTVAGQAVGGLAGAIIVLPAVGFALAPIFEKPEERWESVGPVSRFTEKTYTPVVFTLVEGIGEAGKTTAYVRKAIPDPPFNETQSYEPYVAISTRCAHLGCPVRFVEAAKNFICPCHGGVYDFRGLHVAGPPPRPLDRFFTRVRKGQVEIGPRYSLNSELERFSPRDPGESLDGIGPIVYPARSSTAEFPK